MPKKKTKKTPEALKKYLRGPQGIPPGRYTAKFDEKEGWKVQGPLSVKIGGAYHDMDRLHQSFKSGELLGRAKALEEVVQELKTNLGHALVYDDRVSLTELLTTARKFAEQANEARDAYNKRDE